MAQKEFSSNEGVRVGAISEERESELCKQCQDLLKSTQTTTRPNHNRSTSDSENLY